MGYRLTHLAGKEKRWPMIVIKDVDIGSLSQQQFQKLRFFRITRHQMKRAVRMENFEKEYEARTMPDTPDRRLIIE